MRIAFYQNDWWMMKQVERVHSDDTTRILSFPQDLKKGDHFRMRGPQERGSLLLTIEGHTDFIATEDCGFDPNCGEILIDCEPLVPTLPL